MKIKNEFKRINIKNGTCYYFDDIIRVEDIDFDNILLEKKSFENILIYDISYKALMGVKPLSIRFDEVYGVIKIYDGTRYLQLFSSWFYRRIDDRMNYLIVKKVIINMVLIIILEEPEFIHIIPYIWKKYLYFIML